MTPQEVRQVLADAASTVDGISCKPNFWQGTRPGDAMVRFDHTEYNAPGGGVRTWQIAVVLPQDFALAEQFLDSKIPEVVAAVAAEMQITRVTPAQLALDTATVPVVFVEGLREEDPQ